MTLEHLNRSFPLSGGALRVGGLRYLCQKLGNETIILRPESDVPAVEGEKLFANGNFLPILEEIAPDILIVEQWALLDGLPQLNFPVICDLHGSLFWENWYKSYRDPAQLMAKVHCLHNADFFFVPGDRQLYYFLGWGMMAGLPCEEDRILKVPMVLDPGWYDRQEVPNRDSLVAGGGKWPWVLTDHEEELHKFLGSQGLALESFYYDPRVSRAGETGVGLKSPGSEGIPHQSIVKTYSEAFAALDLYWFNRERELAVTTRTVEYLYCGLPVIYSEGMELSSLLRSKKMGIVVDSWKDLLGISDLKMKLEKARAGVESWMRKNEWENQALEVLSNCFRSLSKRRKGSFSIGYLESEARELRKQLKVANKTLELVENRNEFLSEERGFYRDLWVSDTRKGLKNLVGSMDKGKDEGGEG